MTRLATITAFAALLATTAPQMTLAQSATEEDTATTEADTSATSDSAEGMATAESTEGTDAPLPEEVRAEFNETMAMISDFTVEQRDEALTAIEGTFQTIDSELDARQAALREDWAQLSAATKEERLAAVNALREARYELTESYGAIGATSEDLWEAVRTGVTDAYDRLSDLWQADS